MKLSPENANVALLAKFTTGLSLNKDKIIENIKAILKKVKEMPEKMSNYTFRNMRPLRRVLANENTTKQLLNALRKAYNINNDNLNLSSYNLFEFKS